METGRFLPGQFPPCQLPPRQSPLGQLPPMPIAPRTIDPCANSRPWSIAPFHSIAHHWTSQLSELSNSFPKGFISISNVYFRHCNRKFFSDTQTGVDNYSLIISSLKNAHASPLESFPGEKYH